MALDEPLGVVGGDEGGHRLAQVVDIVVEPGPEALLLKGLDSPLGAAVALGLADIGGVVGDAQPAQRAGEEWAERYCGPQSWRSPSPRPMSDPQLATGAQHPAVEYGVVNRLQGG